MKNGIAWPVVLKKLAEQKPDPWARVYDHMKERVLAAQLASGLYNQQLTEQRQYGTGPDGGTYSINSLWIMVRAAESDDPELHTSARKALAFYKQHFETDNYLVIAYDADGNKDSTHTSPWTYALVGRAAFALGDLDFGIKMLDHIGAYQVHDIESPLYGAIAENKNDTHVSQFTMQESILTGQAATLA